MAKVVVVAAVAVAVVVLLVLVLVLVLLVLVDRYYYISKPCARPCAFLRLTDKNNQKN